VRDLLEGHITLELVRLRGLRTMGSGFFRDAGYGNKRVQRSQKKSLYVDRGMDYFW
jgi:hypothetical protein